MINVKVEVLSSLAETLEIEGNSDTVSMMQEIEEGKTVKDLLNRLATRYPRFVQVVFEVKSQKLTDRANIFYNGHNLELANGLSTKLATVILYPLLHLLLEGKLFISSCSAERTA